MGILLSPAENHFKHPTLITVMGSERINICGLSGIGDGRVIPSLNNFLFFDAMAMISKGSPMPIFGSPK
jgi:hypothetical protein